MRAILGIDAAWTDGQPSGVALVEGEASSWSIVCVAPSYQAFVDRSRGIPVDWQGGRFRGEAPDVGALIKAARTLIDGELSVVAVDMPLARGPIVGRRVADSAISRGFGGKGCSTHSPSASRPGRLGAQFMAQLVREGFPLTTSSRTSPGSPGSIEVYPHPALLTLLSRDYRVPYKASHSLKYWKGTSVAERISRLLDEFGQINCALGSALGGRLPVVLPGSRDVPTLAALKRYEDALDATICAWVGTRFARGEADPHGDEFAAIWVPRAAT